VLTTLATELGCDDESDMVRAADGTIYVAEDLTGRVLAIAPDGTRTAVTGPEAAEDAAKAIRVPSGLGVGPDGTLYVADSTTSLVHARSPQGAWRVVAGTQAAQQQGDVTNFAISLPGGLAVDAAGDVYVAEGGSHTIKRFRGGKLEIVAGGLRGRGGDGGPATQAKLSAPTGLTMHEGALYVIDTGNRALRRIGPDGTITLHAGGTAGKTRFAAGETAPATGLDLSGGLDLAFAPDGRLYWTNQAVGQVARLTPGAGGLVGEAVLGVGHDDGSDAVDFGAILGAVFQPEPMKTAVQFPFGLAFDAEGSLYVADAVGCQVFKVTKPGTAEARAEVWAGIPLSELLAKASDIGAEGSLIDDEGFDRRAAGVVLPTGLTFDQAGNLYVAEAGTVNVGALGSVFGGRFPLDPALLPQAPARVRRIGPDGKMTTIAGPGGKFFKDPKAPDALAMPTSLTIDGQGRLVITDSGANLIRILPAGSY
jgi:sugar lactone lactonase YvrE